MASFFDRFRYAYHVAPLHVLKSIWARRALSFKAALARELPMRRATTAGVDEWLGFADFVHFYLPHEGGIHFAGLSILLVQMGPSPVHSLPHCVLVVDTKELADADCVVCNFNIAVSRPAYPGVRGGNHVRGTSPDIVLGHWLRFRESIPSPEAMRRSHWHDGLAVPVLAGRQITDSPSSVGFRAEIPELLFQARYTIRASDRFFVFSAADRTTVRQLREPPAVECSDCPALRWYGEQDRVASQVRAAIGSYFAKDYEPFPSRLDFDRVRSKAVAQPQRSEATSP